MHDVPERTVGGMNTPEADTWRLAAAGDADAFAALFDLLHERVYRQALRLTLNSHDAEDLLAASFLELWRRRDQARVVNGSVLPWLLVTCTNLALNHRRGLKRHRAFLARLPRSEPTTTDAGQSALTAADLDIDPALITAIHRLRPVDQQLLVLVAFEEYPLKDAADALGLPLATTRSRWQRLRRRLASDCTANHLTLALDHTGDLTC